MNRESVDNISLLIAVILALALIVLICSFFW